MALDKILLKLITKFIEGAGEVINGLLIGLTEKVFYAERGFTQSFGVGAVMNFDHVYRFILDFAISLLILKFLKKGFDIYVGWYEGDKDSDPAGLVVNFARAMVTLLSFRFLYDVLTGVVQEFLEGALFTLLSLEVPADLSDAILNLSNAGLFWAFAGLALVICYIILWLKFLVLGVEMFIIRLGFPIACVGLLDSDKGVFAPYLKKLFIICLTAVIQIFLLRLSLIQTGAGHMLWGLATCFAAMKAPRMLQEFMYSYGNGLSFGGMVSGGYHVSRLVQMTKALRKVK